MKKYISEHPWKIIEDGFHPQFNRITESLFSIGNGFMGVRANFEEKYSGDSLQGSYLSGIYYPDKTRVGWWKIGYPEYFAKVLNASNWIGINVFVDGQDLDLDFLEIISFKRELDMQKGLLSRSFRVRFPDEQIVQVQTIRFCSFADPEAGWIKYSITPLNGDMEILLEPYINFDVSNEDSNYDEKFWLKGQEQVEKYQGFVSCQTKKTNFEVCTGMKVRIEGISHPESIKVNPIKKEKYCANMIRVKVLNEQKLDLIKLAVHTSSFHHPGKDLMALNKALMQKLDSTGFDSALQKHQAAWTSIWAESDIVIEGDVSAQQGIRFNIFHLKQTYTGEDPRLNIGPKGFTGEKYGGSTYWDTEAYCLPFYLGTADESVAKNLLIYRYKHLQKAIENAKLLGFKDGAALYPMVTMNGEECHNEWEITFEEIHRNGAIAYAIYEYINSTDDDSYLAKYGLEVLIGIARFWAQRVNWSEAKQKFVILGVTGPNEYENNINNNWYTNYMARWCLEYCMEAYEIVADRFPESLPGIISTTSLNREQEFSYWKQISEQMHLPYNEDLDVFLQQDGFLDKLIIPASEIPKSQRPINQNWSWDRILRSCYIKQADVLQGIYFFEEDFNLETIKNNFDYYEPITVHESSLSPCIHAILAAKLGYHDKAYEMYLRTARLDLDDYNNDTKDGLHITSMAGTWLSFVKGFGGIRIKKGNLKINPFIPEKWDAYAFKLKFRGQIFQFNVNHQNMTVLNLSDQESSVIVRGNVIKIAAGQSAIIRIDDR